MTKQEMAARGYSRVFRGCFELLGRYIDAPDTDAVWQTMAKEACTLCDTTPEDLRPLANGILKGIYDVVEQACKEARSAPKEPPREPPGEKPRYYHFTL